MTLEWMSRISHALGISVEELMTVPPMGFGVVRELVKTPPTEPAPTPSVVLVFTSPRRELEEAMSDLRRAVDDIIAHVTKA